MVSKAAHPQQVFLEGTDEPLGTAVALRRPDEGGRTLDAEEGGRHAIGGPTRRAVAQSLGLSQGAVSGYLSRARAAGIAWPLADDLDDAGLEALLFPPS